MKILTGILAITTIVFGILAYSANSGRGALEAELATSRDTIAQLEHSAKTFQEQAADLRADLDRTKGELVASRASGERPLTINPKDRPNPLRDPDAMRKILEANARAQFEKSFGHFISANKLDDEKKNALIAIMIERGQKHQEIAMKAAAEKKAPDADALKELDKTAAAGFEAILGADLAQSFARYRAASGDVQDIGGFAASAEKGGMPLSEEALHSLYETTVDVVNDTSSFVELREKVDGLIDAYGRPDMRKLADTSADDYIALKKKQNEAILDKAKAFLNAEQITLLGNTMETRITNLQNGFVFAKALMQQGRTGAGGGMGGTLPFVRPAPQPGPNAAPQPQPAPAPAEPAAR